MTAPAERASDTHTSGVDLALLARGALAKGHEARARELAEKALAAAPEDPQVAALAAQVLSHGVPAWHFELVGDGPRNAAYDGALRRAVRPGMRVLEIGAGSGILAMMAARAGASQVVTCEANPAIAAVAQANIARNGYASRIRVLAKHSFDLDAEADLGGRADLMVSEIISSDVLSQHVLPITRRAIAELLTPGALVIPASATVRVCLAHSDLVDRNRIGMVDGLELGALNRLAPPRWGQSPGDPELQLASEPADLFVFDLRSAAQPSKDIAKVVLDSSAPANCVVQWFELCMDAEGRFENRPGVGARSCWDVLVYPLHGPGHLPAGARVAVSGTCRDNSLQIWASPV
jgi:type II protein arginine methyltransferase